MKIKCSSCDKAINIPDEKLPKDKAFFITCPGCKQKTKVDQHLRPAAPKSAPPPPPPPRQKIEEEEDMLDLDSLVESDPLVEEEEEEEEQIFYEEGAKIALILDDPNKETWTRELEGLDYKIQYAKSPEHAAHKMKFTQFHIIALNEKYKNMSLKNNVAYKFLIEMQMSLRRKTFVVLVGDDFKSMNNMQAFAASVNLVLNQKDLGNLAPLLKQAIADNDLFYKGFKEIMTTLGKV